MWNDGEDVRYLHKFSNPLSHMMICVERNWMVILLGPTASGKNSLVKLLADTTGNNLHVFAVNSSIDTTELLGM